MNGSNNAGGKINLSGTYGLGLEMDPWAYEARGRNRGIEIGRQEGYSNGYSSGISVGNDEGLINGIGIGADIAWNEANAIIDQLRTAFDNERSDYNRVSVALNALRMTIETLIKENPKAASHIRKVFVKNYNSKVLDSIRNHTIDMAPHMNPSFMDKSPKMQEFILRSFRS
ncbi:hypothetical protein EHV23_15115 [Lautropia dentalis]|uniref:Essential protein Yae1 N-terminal domain-containing protein n=1 Tax=Lautropia dentalis TaxID=2490857 RepID=A0A3R8T053_9BURK|nr:hypothetical protein [Lautropia dentalis]RRN43387.1 hypothetical protein EHV23_15115 [Lautropia dentalis]